MNRRIVVIDGNSLINRAYYAIQRPMITKEGLYTHGVYGFLNMLNKIRTDYEPGYLAVTFDRKAPTFRHQEYAEYKAGRKKMPPELAMQMPLLKDVLAAMNIKILEMDGFEADDIIGTIAKRAEEEGLEPLIITGDKDELQLVSDKTKVIITKRGITEFELYDLDKMQEKYGFGPAEFIDYKGLMGDASDNIPGIPGVGEKTAQKLILEFGSVENLIANVDKVSSAKLRDKIEENAQLALMSRRLAEINTEVPIEICFDEFLEEEPDYDKLIEQYRKLEFNSFLKRLKPSDQGESSAGAKSASQKGNGITGVESTKTAGFTVDSEGILPERNIDIKLITVNQTHQLSELEEVLKEGNQVVIKVFTDGNHKDVPSLYGVFILTGEKGFYINTELPELINSLREMINKYSIRVVGHNLVKDYYPLFCHDFDETRIETDFDTAIAQYLIDPARSNYDLKTLILEYFHQEMPSEEEFNTNSGQMDFLSGSEQQDNGFAEYGLLWCTWVDAFSRLLRGKIENEELENVLEKVELPLIRVLASMEKEGFTLDKEELREAGTAISKTLEELTGRIYELAGEEFNINSPKQLGVILFEKLGLPAGKKTKTGYSTNAEILEKLRDDYEIADKVLEYRTLAKLLGTYIEGMLPLVHKDGKIHAHFQQTVTATGRISCTEPNLQNIPIRQELGRKLRKAFIAGSSDYTLVGADYSQIELRVLAHMSSDESLIEAFNEGDDIHSITASRVFGVPQDMVTPLQRSNAKAVNFGVIYGMSGFGLSTELNITRKEAEAYINEYFKKYVQVKAFMDDQVAQCKAQGYVTTIMGRKRRIPEITAGNYMVRQMGERLAMNSPIQGSAADIIKIAMIRVYEELKRRNLKSRLILQVHDELIIETHRDELEEVKKLLVENMENAVELKVKLSADLNSGDNWYDLK